MLYLEHVSKTFNPGTVNEKKALTDLSLHLAPGDFVTIVGSNGAGKSTLFNAVAGNFYVDEGSIRLDGRDITYMQEYKRSRNIGRLFQDPLKGTAPHMTIERELFREKLSLLDMGLEDRMSQPVGLLSGGQRQALTLLMATIVPPRLLLLDEHTAALDPAAAEKVLKLTEEIVGEHKITCMMVTHNMHQALSVGNRTLMMEGGSIVLDISGPERESMTVRELIGRFRAGTGKDMDNDRILLS